MYVGFHKGYPLHNAPCRLCLKLPALPEVSIKPSIQASRERHACVLDNMVITVNGLPKFMISSGTQAWGLSLCKLSTSNIRALLPDSISVIYEQRSSDFMF
jgi:hypothetical protein